jgi:hypothetical protein
LGEERTRSSRSRQSSNKHGRCSELQSSKRGLRLGLVRRNNAVTFVAPVSGPLSRNPTRISSALTHITTWLGRPPALVSTPVPQVLLYSLPDPVFDRGLSSQCRSRPPRDNPLLLLARPPKPLPSWPSGAPIFRSHANPTSKEAEAYTLE